MLSIDLVGPLAPTRRGNTTILVRSDYFTRWIDVSPLPNGTAEVVAEALKHWAFCYLGVPERVHSDQGS